MRVGPITPIAPMIRPPSPRAGATIIDTPEVEPTNNFGERQIRHAVIWRKGCFGTDSAAGSRFVERMLTVITTLRQQQRNVLEFVTTACRAQLTGDPKPSLAPNQHHYARGRVEP